jgi:uncharacterized protein (DUF362 family)
MMKHRVIIRKCETYDTDRISGIIREGMEELAIKPTGRILLKPNVVLAHQDIFPHAFTRKEFLDGALSATIKMSENVKEIAVGERCGITVATRYSFKNAGYPEVIKKHKAKALYFDEVKKVPFELKRPEKLRDRIFIPKPVANCDFFINLPKFKAHPWTRLTLSLKNYIGIQDDRYRLVDHNSFLEHKIADLQEVVQSKFIAIDGIMAGQKMMLTPTPFPLGAIVMGTNSCAVDTVGCHMVHVDPPDLIHLRFASKRGFGPMNLEDIDVTGDYPLEEVQDKTKTFEFCMETIDNYFGKESNLSCTVGRFPEKHSPEYCWGGCPGALQEAMHIFRGFRPEVDQEMKKIRYVVGRTNENLNVAEDEKILFAGDCTEWKGEVDGKEVKINGVYKTTKDVGPKGTKSGDLIMTFVKSMWNCLKSRNSRYLRAGGCPISVAEHVNYIASLTKIPNPNLDLMLVIPVNMAYIQMRFSRIFHKVFG